MSKFSQFRIGPCQTAVLLDKCDTQICILQVIFRPVLDCDIQVSVKNGLGTHLCVFRDGLRGDQFLICRVLEWANSRGRDRVDNENDDHQLKPARRRTHATVRKRAAIKLETSSQLLNGNA